MSKSMPREGIQDELRKTFGRFPAPTATTRRSGNAQARTSADPESRTHGKPQTRKAGQPRARASAKPGSRKSGATPRKLTCLVDPDIYKRLKLHAIQEDQTLDSLAASIIHKFVESLDH